MDTSRSRITVALDKQRDAHRHFLWQQCTSPPSWRHIPLRPERKLSRLPAHSQSRIKEHPAKEKAFSARIGHASGDSACDCATLSPQSALRATNPERAAWNHDSVDAGGPKRHQSRRCEDQEGSPRIAPMATNHPLIPRTAPGASEPHEIHLVLHPSPKLQPIFFIPPTQQPTPSIIKLRRIIFCPRHPSGEHAFLPRSTVCS
jgi:hypothetical protein